MSLADHICTSPSSSRCPISAVPGYTPNDDTEPAEQPGSDLPHLGPDSASQSNYLPLQDPAIQSLPTSNSPQKFVGYLRPGKNVPPRIDAFVAST